MTPHEAQNAVFALFKAAWDANTPAVNGGEIPLVRWENVGSPEFPPKVEPWARVGMAHIGAKIHSLGGVGNRVYVQEAMLLVQIYTPSAFGGTQLGHDLAKVAFDAFLGQQAGPNDEIWFRDVDIQERGPVVPGWWQVNVRAYFEYQSVA